MFEHAQLYNLEAELPEGGFPAVDIHSASACGAPERCELDCLAAAARQSAKGSRN
jgi:hypothetical protein